MGRKIAAIMLVSSILFVAAACGWVLLRDDGVSPETCAKIKPGMPEKEAMSILGSGWDPEQDPQINGGVGRVWTGRRGRLFVVFVPPPPPPSHPQPKRPPKRWVYSARFEPWTPESLREWREDWWRSLWNLPREAA
jgi:hypothetical protein